MQSKNDRNSNGECSTFRFSVFSTLKERSKYIGGCHYCLTVGIILRNVKYMLGGRGYSHIQRKKLLVIPFRG